MTMFTTARKKVGISELGDIFLAYFSNGLGLAPRILGRSIGIVRDHLTQWIEDVCSRRTSGTSRRSHDLVIGLTHFCLRAHRFDHTLWFRRNDLVMMAGRRCFVRLLHFGFGRP